MPSEVRQCTRLEDHIILLITVALTPLHARVVTEIRRRQLLFKNQRILVAVSGGQDSMCLLQMLRDLASRWQWQLFVVHCDHRWTPDETLCAQYLEQWLGEQGLSYTIETTEEITLDEDRARQWRYQVLGQWAHRWNCSTIVTGHTGTDVAETFLFNLMRGTGPQGLASLTWSRPLNQQDPQSPWLVRPFLNVWRHETAAFCQTYQLPVWSDLTNQNLNHGRNRIRLELMPYLRQHFNPQVELALTRIATLITAEHDYVIQSTLEIWPQIYREPPPQLDRQILKHQPIALQRQIIFTILCHHLTCAPRFAQVEDVLRLLAAPRKSRSSTFPGGGWVEVVDHWIVFQGFPRADPLDHHNFVKVYKDAYDEAVDPNQEVV